MEWTERNPRVDWEVAYTLIGGKWRSSDPLVALTAAQRRPIERFASQAFVACTSSVQDLGPDVAYWATVCTKILQRGTGPAVSPRAEELSGGPPNPDFIDESLTATMLFEPPSPAQSWALDPSIELHATWEQPFLESVQTLRPDLLPWITPQAPLEALGRDTGATSRWVDFLVARPGDRPVVIEVDGAAHARQRGVDDGRDRLLRDAKVEVVRLDGPQVKRLGWLGDELDRLFPKSAVELDGDLAELQRAVLGPASLHRFGVALVQAVIRGFLPPGQPWIVELQDPIGLVESAAGAILDLLAAIDAVWGTQVVPAEVTVGQTQWNCREHRYQSIPANPGGAPAQVRVVLDPDHPPQAALPAPDGPQVVIRHAFIPTQVTWLKGVSAERRDLVPSAALAGPLQVVLSEVFGLEGFRDGQLQAVERVLTGKDSVVMLPTGAGKSLIYQLCGLLRPGITLAVDPIVSLIDDQERRLREEGIDRVSGLHAAALKRAPSKEAVYRAVASGESLFVFVSPERLQIQRFRDHLAGAAEHTLVNLCVIDEAHCVSEWGHDFRTSYLRLGRNLRLLCRGLDDVPPPLLALTGTASPAVLRDVMRELDIDPQDEGSLQRPKTFDRPNLHYHVLAVSPAGRHAQLQDLLGSGLPDAFAQPAVELFAPNGEKTASGIVFVPHTNGKSGVIATRDTVKGALNQVLTGSDVDPDVEIYSGQQPKATGDASWDEAKAVAAERFKRNASPVLVSTKAFGMGIDKPNIRYTIHLGIPSSIEAFAQEAGRAGRDQLDSECFLIAGLPRQEVARQMLDLRATREVRFGEYARLQQTRLNDDLSHQLFFLYNSFPSREAEIDDAIGVFEELTTVSGPGGGASIPRIPRPHGEGRVEETASRREKALYRLSILGIVDDYTIDYGAGAFDVYLDNYSAEHIDQALLTYAQRVEPGRLGAHRRAIAGAPVDLHQRVCHHLRVEVEILYRVIEPARLRALDEMYRLAVGDPSDESVRRRINAYLGDGPLAAILPSLVGMAERIDVDEVFMALGTVPPVDPFEWAGASARQLEDTPEHPIALTASALAQAWLPDGDPERFLGLVQSAIEQAVVYDVDDDDVARLFLWICHQLRTQAGGRRRDWCAIAWLGLPAALDASERLQREEARVLGTKLAPARERRVILDRRFRRDSHLVRELVAAHIGGDADV